MSIKDGKALVMKAKGTNEGGDFTYKKVSLDELKEINNNQLPEPAFKE